MGVAEIKFKINGPGVEKILKDQRSAAMLLGRAQRIAAAAGPGMRASVVIGRNRARASVVTETKAAKRAEATKRALTRAIDAGRN